ncbi:hypothetical protein DNL40_02640 [Xylanimonas oleitrophica]|uniref:Uncharacterized protein n=1 Tax=Xylanimonas oleitrophica TaxID=2607479 RepID=A0A2W5WVF8_9MICO|nr:hypothetical protein [Xylanimonas oleitrophica]PZR55287.1 hypothetical protein DNL40_02640 [Xylanimonas oleitrophica]
MSAEHIATAPDRDRPAPTTAQVRSAFVACRMNIDTVPVTRRAAESEFDAWLARHDAEVEAHAAREATERAAVTAWTVGMEDGPRMAEAREYGSAIAREIRARAEKPGGRRG